MSTGARTLVQAVLAHGEREPERLAVALREERVTYGELCRRVKAMAFELASRYGVERGDRIAVSAVSRPDYIVALLAVQYLGAVSLPLDKSAKETAILDICQFTAPKLVLTDVKLERCSCAVSLKDLYAKAVQAAPVELNYEIPAPGELAEILFTTGTTGKPKGAMLTYDSLQASMENTWHGIGMKTDDRLLLPLPLNHSFGMRVLRSALYIGAAVVLQNGFTFAKEIEINIDKFNCTAFAAVPASIELVRRQMGEYFSSVIGRLRYIEIGAGALPIDLRKKLLAELPHTEIHNTWGSTETGGALFLNLRFRPDKLTSAGKPLDGIELKVVDTQGNVIKAKNIDSAGRMLLRGRMQMSGYYNMPEQTAETLTDGWLWTNDLVYTDEDGFVYMLGRADDIINVGGEKVSPVEVERAAQEFEGVQECACIGVDDPDGITGKAPVLYIVPEANFQEKDLAKFLASKLERYKLPKRYILAQALPRNRMEKLDRKALLCTWEETGGRPLTNEVIRCLLERRSIRDFTDKPVPKAYLETILQTGIHAPSGHNMQTWQFTVLQSQERIERLKAVTEDVAKRQKVYFYGFNNPQAVILVSNDRRNRDGIQDSSCAAENMMLAAYSLGLGSVWVNALCTISDEPEIRALLDEFGILPRHIVWATLALGWPKEPGKLLAKKQNVIHWVDAT